MRSRLPAVLPLAFSALLSLVALRRADAQGTVAGMRIVLTNEGDVDLPSIYYDVD